MPIPASYQVVPNPGDEYSAVLAGIAQPEQFIYCETWDETFSVTEPGPAPFIKYRYLHMPGCMLYKIPLDPPPPPIPA